MGRPKRGEQFSCDEVGIVHVVQRCVRRAFLAGLDEATGKDYSFRREWIRRRMELLASVFDKMVRGMFGEDFRQIALAQMIETAEAIDEQLLDDISDLIEQRKKNG